MNEEELIVSLISFLSVFKFENSEIISFCLNLHELSFRINLIVDSNGPEKYGNLMLTFSKLQEITFPELSSAETTRAIIDSVVFSGKENEHKIEIKLKGTSKNYANKLN